MGKLPHENVLADRCRLRVLVNPFAALFFIFHF